VRDRIARTQPGSGSSGTTTRDATGRLGGGTVGSGTAGSGTGAGVAPVGGGGLAPIGSGGVAPIGGGGLAPIGGGSVAPVDGGRINRGGSEGTTGSGTAGSSGGNTSPGWRDAGGGIRRGGDPSTPSTDRDVRHGEDGAAVDRSRTRDGGSTATVGGSWRDRVQRPATSAPSGDPAAPATTTPAPKDDGWRNGGGLNRGSDGSRPRSTEAPPAADPSSTRSRGSDVPRRIIDRIGGARVSPDNGSSGRSGGSSSSGHSGSGGSADVHADINSIR